MKDKTKVKAKNVWKVAEILADDPNVTRREIQKETGLHPLTIQKAKEELNQNWTKDETIAYIVGSAKTRLQRISSIKDRYIDKIEEWDEIKRADVDLANKLWQEDMKLVTVLWWDATKSDWWYVSIQSMTFDSLQ